MKSSDRATPEITLRRLAIRVAALLPDDKADATIVLQLAAELVNGFLSVDQSSFGREASMRRETTSGDMPLMSPENI